MADPFASTARGINGPITSSVAVTPDDSNDLANVTRALHANTSGNVEVIMLDDSVSVIKAVVSGVTYPWRVKRVKAAGTTASVVAEY